MFIADWGAKAIDRAGYLCVSMSKVVVVNLGLDEVEDLFQTRQDRGGARVQWQEFKESKGIFQVTRYRTMETGKAEVFILV